MTLEKTGKLGESIVRGVGGVAFGQLTDVVAKRGMCDVTGLTLHHDTVKV